MELTILLSKVFGIYFILVGVLMLFRRSYLKSITQNFVDEPMLRFLIGALMLMGGIFLIVAHQDWTTLPAGFISLLGWLTALKALLYMSLSNRGVKKWVDWFWVKGKYGWWGSFLALALGVYLVNFGFVLF